MKTLEFVELNEQEMEEVNGGLASSILYVPAGIFVILTQLPLPTFP